MCIVEEKQLHVLKSWVSRNTNSFVRYFPIPTRQVGIVFLPRIKVSADTCACHYLPGLLYPPRNTQPNTQFGG